jgi:hypothetical protein
MAVKTQKAKISATGWLRRFRLASLSISVATAMVFGTVNVANSNPVDTGANSTIDYSLVTYSAGQRVPSSGEPPAGSAFAHRPSGEGISPTGTNNFSIQFWTKPSAATVSTSDCNSKLPFNLAGKLAVSVTCGKWVYYIGTGPVWTHGPLDTGVFAQAVWTHIQVDFIGGFVDFYVDGVKVHNTITDRDSGTADAAGLTIGAWWNDQNGSYSGEVDEVKIWNTFRAGNAQTDMHTRPNLSDANLLAYWDFNEPSGATIYDRIAGRNLTAFRDADLRRDVKQSTVDGARQVIAFPRTYLPGVGGWTVPAHVTSVKALAVAGGGGGGAWIGGGGGAGGFFETDQPATVTPGAALRIQVGQGGRGSQFQDSDGDSPNHLNANLAVPNTNGQDSFFGNQLVPGGGAGANYLRAETIVAKSGGSGGGGAIPTHLAAHRIGGLAVAGGFGNDGGDGIDNSFQPHESGGGGGAGAPGGDATAGVSGAGGIGKTSSVASAATLTTLGVGDVDGSDVFFAGGGGGSIHGNDVGTFAAAPGGKGGGGAGNSMGSDYPDTVRGESGQPNTGGGGGGSANLNTKISIGGNGGSGVVVISYLTPTVPGTVTGFAASQRPIDADTNADSVALTWTPITGHSPAVTGYEIEWDTNSNIDPTSTNFGSQDVSGESTASYQVTGLNDGETYFFRIRAVNGVGASVTWATASSVPLAVDDYAYEFDGATDRMTTGNPGPLNRNEFTLELWVKWDGGGSTWRTFIHQYESNTDRIYIAVNPDGELQYAWGDGQVAISRSRFTLPTNEWTHLALTRDSTGAPSFFVNGSLISSSTTRYTRAPNAPLILGTRNSEWFGGQLDQVKVWDSDLLDTEIRASMHAHGSSRPDGTPVAAGKNLVAHYDFNDFTNSATVEDQSGNFDLTVTSGEPSNFVHVVEAQTEPGRVIYDFTRSYLTETGGWAAPSGVASFDVLVVAGGGAGGSRHGGGGGAGGLAHGSVALNGAVPVVVGQGGLGAAATAPSSGCLPAESTNGQSSNLGSIEVVGGGRGGAGCNGHDSASGGSSGGTSSTTQTLYQPSSTGSVAGITYLGFAGGIGKTNPTNAWAGGGGGGAGGLGFNALEVDGLNNAGFGGKGYVSSILGSPYCFAGGGGAGVGAAGGLAGSATVCDDGVPATAGDGSKSAVAAFSAQANSGSGGGGSGYNGDSNGASGSGGSGRIVVAYTAALASASNPASVSKLPSETATFSTTASGNGTVSVQWQLSTNGTDWNDVAGATSHTYTTPALTEADNGNQYRARVTDSINGTTDVATTAAATLTVTGTTATVSLSYASATYSPGGILSATVSNGGHDGTPAYSSSTPTKCTVNSASGAVNIVEAGDCSITVSWPQTAAYLAATATANFTISKANQSALTWDQSKISYDYLGNLDASSAIGGGTLPRSGNLSFLASQASSCQVTGSVISGGAAGSVCSVTVTLAGDVNYEPISLTQVITVNKINQSALAIVNPGSLTFGDSVQLSATGGSGTGALTFSTASAAVCTVTTSGLLEVIGVGDCVVTVDKALDTNYDAVSGSRTITTAKATHTVSFTSTVPANPIVNDDYQVTGVSSTGDSALAPTFSIAAASASICEIAGNTVTFKLDGVCEIEASRAATANYEAAATVTQRIVVGQANQSITFASIADKPFGAPAFTLSGTSTSGNAVTFSTGPGTTNSACSVTSAGLVVVAAVGTCEVVANSASGNGYAAASSVSRTFEISAVQAGRPFITAVSFGDQTLTATYFAPSYLGGGTISGYRLQAFDAADNLVATQTSCATSGTLSCTVTGLTNGTNYTLKIAVITEAGVGLESSESAAVAPAANPEAVTALTAVQGDQKLTISWRAPSNLGGGTFDSFRIFVREAGGSYPSSPDDTLFSPDVAARTVNGVTTVELTGLTNGQAYDVRVVTVTQANTAQLTSNTAEVTQTPYTVPDAPPSVTVLEVGDDIVITWSQPVFDGGSAISGFSVLLDSVAATCTATSATSCTIPKSTLTPGTTVDIEVKAENDAGPSAPATAQFAVAALATVTTPGQNAAPAQGPAAGLEALSGQARAWTKRISPTQVRVYIKFPEMGSNYQVNLQRNDGAYVRVMSKTINTTADTDLRVVGDWYYLVKTIDIEDAGRYRIEVTQDNERMPLNGRDRPAVYNIR